MNINFDPNSSGAANLGIFGIPTSLEQSKLVLIPVPWEVTTSYGKGAALGPELIHRASAQVDLFDLELGKIYEQGFHLLEIPQHLKKLNTQTRTKAQNLISIQAGEIDLSKEQENSIIQDVNSACTQMTKWVYDCSIKYLQQGKLVGLIGGDHSTPLGLIQALSEYHGRKFGVLHIDAHADLRKAYQGFEQSHASIMYNVSQAPWSPEKLIQIGIRDFCEDEFLLIERDANIHTFFDLQLKNRMLQGETWHGICQDIIAYLPEKIYISFDIDGLDPVYCPNTGTPVPGGLSIDQIFYLFNQINAAGKKIIGFDLNEVSTGGLELDQADDWDGNVGARILYKLCGWTCLQGRHKGSL